MDNQKNENAKIKKSKTIIRREKNKENLYVMINKKSLQDNNLSLKAKGLLAYLLSLPDDWKIYLQELTKHCTDGITSIRTAIAELIKKRYLVRNILRDEKKRFCGYEYILFETKQEITEIRKAKNGNNEIGKTNATNNNNTNNNNTNNEREESPPLEQTLDLSELTSQPKSENEQLYSEYNQYKNRFKTLIKTYKLGIDKKQIEIICQTERNSIDEWKALKTRMKFDNNNRLLNFDDYARNYLNSTAECYVKPLSWTKFIKFYEKFNKVQVPFQDKLNHHDTQDENRISNEKFLERVNFKEEWTPETIQLYKTMIENNEKDGIDVTELKAELEQILREQDEQSK